MLVESSSVEVTLVVIVEYSCDGGVELCCKVVDWIVCTDGDSKLVIKNGVIVVRR